MVSVGGKPYPLPIRALSFDTLHSLVDPQYDQPECKVYAKSLRDRFRQRAEKVIGETFSSGVKSARNGQVVSVMPPTDSTDADGRLVEDGEADLLDAVEHRAIATIQENIQLKSRVESKGAAWGAIKALILQVVPETFEDRDEIAFHLVSKVLNAVFGDQQQGGWHSFKNPATGNTWVKTGPRP